MASKCVRTSPGYWVSFDQASQLMDQDLLSAVRGSLQDEHTRGPREGLVSDEQWIWARYCERHRERYNDQFLPDRDPCWDFPIAELEGIRAVRVPPENPSVFVTSSHGFRVDFEKACLEMDPAVLARAKREMHEESTNHPVRGTIYDAQWLWDRYCFLHIWTHDVWFDPDVIPCWDLSAEETWKLIRMLPPIPLPDLPGATP